MINLNEQFYQLNELIRKVNNVLFPYDRKNLEWLQKKEIRDILYGKHPKCFLSIKSKYGDSLPFFCICNMSGVHDPNIISFSIKLAQKLKTLGNYENEEIEAILTKLHRLYNTYTKDVIKPPKEAARKGKQTRNFTKIKKYLDKVST